jgi:hypothetical protein
MLCGSTPQIGDLTSRLLFGGQPVFKAASIDLPFGQRLSILFGLAAASLVGLLLLDPIPQDPIYHLFADTRTLMGIPNFNDVFSNVGFTIVALFTLNIVQIDKSV